MNDVGGEGGGRGVRERKMLLALAAREGEVENFSKVDFIVIFKRKIGSELTFEKCDFVFYTGCCVERRAGWEYGFGQLSESHDF